MCLTMNKASRQWYKGNWALPLVPYSTCENNAREAVPAELWPPIRCCISRHTETCYSATRHWQFGSKKSPFCYQKGLFLTKLRQWIGKVP